MSEAADLDALHADLLALRDQLQGLLRDDTNAAGTVELDQTTQGRLSRIDAMQQQEMVKAQHRRAAVRLDRVEVLLEAWGTPLFGACRECEEPIAAGRLRARPDSLFCMDCLRARESG